MSMIALKLFIEVQWRSIFESRFIDKFANSPVDGTHGLRFCYYLCVARNMAERESKNELRYDDYDQLGIHHYYYKLILHNLKKIIQRDVSNNIQNPRVVR